MQAGLPEMPAGKQISLQIKTTPESTTIPTIDSGQMRWTGKRRSSEQGPLLWIFPASSATRRETIRSPWSGTSLLLDVSSSLAGRKILLTGANGFLGKVLLGLLLDRYPDVGQVHLLIRSRRGRSAQDRFEKEILDSPPVAPLVNQRGRDFFRDKITVWSGDAAQVNAGIDDADWSNGIDLIIHCAGLVEFFPPVDQSLRANVDAVEQIAVLAQRAGSKLLHVSTCYVAGKADGLIEETEPLPGFYPDRRGPNDHRFEPAAELRTLREEIDRITASSAGERDKADQLISIGRRRAAQWGWVNTYTYTKSLGEQILAQSQGLDWAIVRPAIVESSWRFPFPGWIEGGRTAAPLVLMALSGLTEWPARPDIPLEVVPVDQVAAATLACGALLLAGQHQPVYQLASADTNPFELGLLIQLLFEEARRLNGGSAWKHTGPFGWQPYSRLRFLSPTEFQKSREVQIRRIETSRRLLTAFQERLQRTPIPDNGVVADWLGSLRTLALQARFRDQTINQYLPFIFENRYVYETYNIRAAYRILSPSDREKLPWRPEAIDWPEYWRENQIGGIRKWVQPEAVRNWSFQI